MPVVSQFQVSVEVFSDMSFEVDNIFMECIVIIRQDTWLVLVNTAYLGLALSRRACCGCSPGNESSRSESHGAFYGH